jgi:hypothetical protein
MSKANAGRGGWWRGYHRNDIEILGDDRNLFQDQGARARGGGGGGDNNTKKQAATVGRIHQCNFIVSNAPHIIVGGEGGWEATAKNKRLPEGGVSSALFMSQTPLLRSCGVTRERERKRGSRERDSEEREGEERERESSVSLSSLSSLSLSLSLLSLTSKQAACMFGCVIFLCIVMRTFGFALYSSCSLLLLSSFPATLQLEKRRQNGSRCCCHCCCWCCS